MTPSQLAFVNGHLKEETTRLVKRKVSGPWWRLLVHRLRCIWNPWECVEEELVLVPRTCDRCDSKVPVEVAGFTDVGIFDNVVLNAKRTRTMCLLLVRCATCGMMQVLDPVALGILDGEGRFLAP